MKRYTKRSENGNVYICVTNVEDLCFMNRPIQERMFCVGCKGSTDRKKCGPLVVIDCLAAYEDNGLEPEEITRLQNKPLTLDELREMDGKPVWIVGVSCINNFKGHWDICDWENGEKVLFPHCMETPDLADYDPEGKLGVAGWRAYRRKPEVE